MSKAVKIFISTFIISCVVLVPLWLQKGGLDIIYWATDAQKLADHQPIIPTDITFGYPGTTLLLPTMALIKLGVPYLPASQVVTALWLALLIAAVGYMAYILRPQSRWWMAVVGIFIVEPLYYVATPPSALMCPLLALLILLTLYIYEHRHQVSLWPYTWLGIGFGVALATRFDISVVLIAGIVLFLFFTTGKKILISLLYGIVLFFVFVPFLWNSPMGYAQLVYEKIVMHLHQERGTSFVNFIAASPFAIMSFIWAGVLLGYKKLVSPVPRIFLAWLMILSVSIVLLLLQSSHHPVWFFFPLFFVWEMLFPLFIFTLLESSSHHFTRFGGTYRLITDLIILLILLRGAEALYIRCLALLYVLL